MTATIAVYNWSCIAVLFSSLSYSLNFKRQQFLQFEMKAVLVLSLLALAFVCVFAIGDECDPDSNGKPVCTADNLGPSRNFWDPTHYWLCSKAGEEPESKRCPSSYLYKSDTKECIHASKWVWTSPCPI